MGEKNLWSKLGLIVLIVGLCVWQSWPPGERLKPGIDLGGGHSLLFGIDESGLEAWQKTELAQRVMAILKNRVDPQGSRNLVWRPIGRNRIEIQMPKPPDKQLEKRQAFEKTRDELVATNITAAQIRGSLVKPADQRDGDFARMSERVPSRKALFEKLVAAEEEYNRLNKEYEDLGPAATQPAATTSQPASGAASQPAATQPAAGAELAQRIDKARAERYGLIKQLVDTNIEIGKLTDLLDLGRGSGVRKEGLEEIKKTHPDFAPRIDEMVKQYDDYAKVKGALDDPADLIRLLRGAGVLEFRILAEYSGGKTLESSNPKYNDPVDKYRKQLQERGPRPQRGDNYGWFKIAKHDEERWKDPPYIVQDYMEDTYVLAHLNKDMALINDRTWALTSARQGRDDMGRIAVNFELDARGGTQFGGLTGRNINRPLCIFLDNQAVSSANINSRIYTRGQISGDFTPEYVMYLVNTLEAGSLPARLNEVPLQEKSVGPALGETNRKKGQQAIVIAFLLTVAFMAVYYAYSGLIADIALLMNLIITLGVMSFLQATFTMPGIAGLILTLGMAVDANVLIFERTREELQRGVSVRMAVKLGYEKAFSAILDSNVTTIITAIILGAIGSEEIKGFGLTLGIGLATSMFTALFVTRQYFNIMVPHTLNTAETKKAWVGVGLLAILGGAIFGLGYLLNGTPEAREESGLVALGRFLGIMFATALALMVSIWAFRLVYAGIGHQKAGRLPMMKLFSAPNIDWMGKCKLFWSISAAVIIAGFIFQLSVDKEDYLDIEFLGGTSVQVQLKPENQSMTDEQLKGHIAGKDPTDRSTSEGWLRRAADVLAGAEAADAGDGRYVIRPREALTAGQLEALLLPVVETDIVNRGGIEPAEGGNGVVVQFDRAKAPEAAPSVEAVKAKLVAAAEYARRAAAKIASSRVQLVKEETATGTTRKAFEVITSETRKTLVAEAILASMGGPKGILEVTQKVEAQVVKDPDVAPDGVFLVGQDANVLKDIIGGENAADIAEFKGGLVLQFASMNPPQSEAQIEQRLKDMRQQPDFEDVAALPFKVIGLEQAGTAVSDAKDPLYQRIAVVVNDPSLPNFDEESRELWRTTVAERQLALTSAALDRSQSLQRVTKFEAQVATEAQQKAIIAIVLSFIAIAGYLWLRFGSADFGVAGIIALYHDVAVTLSCVMLSHHIYDTAIGRLLGLTDFRIDLAMIAALLTIVGYSINDTIVIFDRIRENRGRLATVSPVLVNRSINQTLSRTYLTAATVFIGVIVMYAFGGEGIHGFAFAMIIGSISGVYSTVGIAAPILNHPRVMWVVTIFLTAATAAALVMQVENDYIRYTLLVLTLAGALFALIKQLTGRATVTIRQTATA